MLYTHDVENIYDKNIKCCVCDFSAIARLSSGSTFVWTLNSNKIVWKLFFMLGCWWVLVMILVQFSHVFLAAWHNRKTSCLLKTWQNPHNMRMACSYFRHFYSKHFARKGHDCVRLNIYSYVYRKAAEGRKTKLSFIAASYGSILLRITWNIWRAYLFYGDHFTQFFWYF